MNALAKLALVGFVVTITSCTGDSSKPGSSSGGTAGSCTVSFELTYTDKPASNKVLSIYQMIDGKVKTSKEFKLGSGTSDQSGNTTVSFRCVPRATYVILEEVEPDVLMALRSADGKFLSFECGADKTSCDLGKINAALFGR